MKKKIFMSTLVVAILTIAGYGGMRVRDFNVHNQSSGLVAANVEALSQIENAESGVNCYCTMRLIKKNICTSNASGAKCGENVQHCEDYDGNCRK